jgi:hypothetical protein
VLYVTEAGRSDPFALLDVDRVQLAFDAAFPKFEKAAKLRVIGGEVEFLPDEALQQRRVVRQVVDDLGRGEPVPPQLQLQSAHGSPRLAMAPLPERA